MRFFVAVWAAQPLQGRATASYVAGMHRELPTSHPPLSYWASEGTFHAWVASTKNTAAVTTFTAHAQLLDV
jgi:hypothetical protein